MKQTLKIPDTPYALEFDGDICWTLLETIPAHVSERKGREMTREQHIEKDWQDVAEHIRDLRNEPAPRPRVTATPAQDDIDRVLPGAQWQRVRDAWRAWE